MNADNRLPPQDMEAEMSVLGGVLLENEALNKVLELLTAEDFYRESHGKIFAAMTELSEHGEPLDLVTVRSALEKRGELDAVGGMDYLAMLVDFVPTAANIVYYSRLVKEKSLQRRLIRVATEIAQRGYEGGDVEVTLDWAEKLIFEDGADILTFHASHPVTIDVAEENGVYSIGYNSVKKEYSEKFLTAVVFEWEPLYEGILADYFKGSVNNSYWWGAQYGVVKLSPFSSEIPKELIPVIEENMEKFRNGWDVYLGEIYRSDGVKMCDENERISDDALLFKMDWFVEGVEVYE